jgi:hypothetical protein
MEQTKRVLLAGVTVVLVSAVTAFITTVSLRPAVLGRPAPLTCGDGRPRPRGGMQSVARKASLEVANNAARRTSKPITQPLLDTFQAAP